MRLAQISRCHSSGGHHAQHQPPPGGSRLALSSLAIARLGHRQPSRLGRRQIDANVDATLREFSFRVGGARELLAKSAAVLVFPSVIKAGMGIGGEYGEGALLVRGRTAGILQYHLGLLRLPARRAGPIGDHRLHDPRGPRRASGACKGWKVGVDGSVALITVGIGGSVDSSKIASPIVGFIFDGKGLMYNLTLEGSKISRIDR